MAEGSVNSSTDGGVSGKHPPAEPFEVFAAPATADESNLVRFRLIPVACWRVDDIRFRFDSSFVLPDTADEMRHLARLIKQHPGCPLSVFGHADPVGTEDYNKALSGRRATAIYAMLTRNTSLWETLFSQPLGRDDWKKDALETMTQTVSGQPLPSGSTPDARQRKQLFSDYMDKVCGPDLKLEKTDFLGQGADPKGKADYQGCGKFNPVLVFSQAKEAEFDKATDHDPRNAANAHNRRVLVLIFRKGSKVDPSRWPCPRATEGPAGCTRRLFSDGEKRRTTRLPKDDRKYEETEDTYACRFFDRITKDSPCRKLNPLVFKYGLETGERFPWTDAANFRIVSEDGKQQHDFAVGQGTPTGISREFVFSEALPGVRYRGQVVEGDLSIDLFGLVEIFRIQDPSDPLNVLPLPPARPSTLEPPVPIPNVTPSRTDEEFDVDVKSAAEEGSWFDWLSL